MGINLASLSHRSKEAIATAGQRFDKARVFRRVAQRLADFVNGRIQVVIDIDKSVRPQPLLQFLPRHHLAGAL